MFPFFLKKREKNWAPGEFKVRGIGGSRERIIQNLLRFLLPCSPSDTHPAGGGDEVKLFYHHTPEWRGAFSHWVSNIGKSELGSAEQSLFTLLLSVSAALPNRLGCLFYKSSKWSLLTAKNKLLITFTWINLVTRCGIHLLSVQQLPLRGMREQAKGSL